MDRKNTKSAKALYAKTMGLNKNKDSRRNKILAVMVAVLVLVVGYTIVRLGAAGFFASFEAEQGTQDQAQVISDPTASNGKAIQFAGASTPPPSSGLPAGVTLRDIDGGANYFSKWSNSFPTDPNFFPLAIFNGFNLVDKAPKHKAAGINTYASVYNGTSAEIDAAKANGMRIIGGYEENKTGTAAFNTQYGNTLAGYVYQDEGEGRNICGDVPSFMASLCQASNDKTTTASFVKMSDALRAKDRTRPVYQGWTNGYVFDWFLSGSAAELAKSSDIIGYDVYAKVDKRSTFNEQLSAGRVWGHYETVSLARKHANYAQPVWPDIEISETDTDAEQPLNASGYRPTGAEIKAMVWQAIIGGARGITYFNNCVCEKINVPSQDVLNDSRWAESRTAVTSVNGEVTRLAAVVNSPFAEGYITNINGQVNAMAKYHAASNAIYIFAGAKSTNSQPVTFTIKGGKGVTVENENRTVPLNGGSFQDTFAGESAYHIYKVAL